MKKKIVISDMVFDIVKWIFLLFFFLATIYPILNTLAVSFNEGLDAIRGGIYILPREFTLDNYRSVLSKGSLMTGAYNTVLRTVIGTVTQLFLTALLAFVLSRKEFMFRTPITLLFIFTILD